MKKLLIIPTTDTITLCLPREWVGKSIVCTLREEHLDTPFEVAEPDVAYRKRELTRRMRRNR
jgi:hypothetical protein